MFWDDYETGVTSPGLGLPQWWYTLSVPVLSLLVAPRTVRDGLVERIEQEIAAYNETKKD